MSDLEALKRRAVERVDALADTLVEASHRIHGHPELAFEERYAADLLTAILEGQGVGVARGVCDLPTAFDARVGTEGPLVTVCCEYDALPGLGHACGHNVIATAGLGAGLAAAAVAEEAGGRVAIVGTPAEEGGGGKVLMVERGAFEGVDAAVMVHPADADLARITAVAAARLCVEYHGQAAHAAAAPHRGRNALDAAVLGYVNVAALRQHIQSSERVHGVFLKAGDTFNIVPDHTVMDWMARAATLDELQPLKERVLAALEAGAAATGCQVEHRFTMPDYAEVVDNEPMVALWRGNMAALGREVADPLPGSLVVSTDMGNVSRAVPSIHPTIAVAPPGVPLHSTDFARWSASPDADRAVIDGAKALAMTVVDLWARPGALDEARAAFTPR